jgi:D-sedoheptulose 7-phosphate isomerase
MQWRKSGRVDMEMKAWLQSMVEESISTKQKLLSNHMDEIMNLSQICTEVLKSGGKLLFCGNGGSSCDASHIAAELVVRYKSGNERKSIPAISLTADSAVLTAHSNDYGYASLFERQISGLGRKEDCLVAITTSGNSENIFLGIQEAKRIGMKTVALLGGTGGKIKGLCDAEIIVPAKETARIQESHILIGHMLCSYIEKELFGLT